MPAGQRSKRPVIAVLGGTGALGSALATRWGTAGYSVIIGSRSVHSACARIRELPESARSSIAGASCVDAASAAEIIVVTVPWAAQEETLVSVRGHTAGKIVIDTTVPLVPPRVMRVQLPTEGAAAVRAQRLLGEGTTVVSAFHNVAAHKLAGAQQIDCDVLVFGDVKEAREQVITLVGAAGMGGLHGGPLVNSAAAEALTSVLIFLNKTYSVDGAAIRILGELRGAPRVAHQ